MITQSILKYFYMNFIVYVLKLIIKNIFDDKSENNTLLSYQPLE